MVGSGQDRLRWHAYCGHPYPLLLRHQGGPRRGTLHPYSLVSSSTLMSHPQGRIYPALDRIREISTKIAVAVMEVAFEEKVAGIDRPADLTQYVKARSYVPLY